VCMST